MDGDATIDEIFALFARRGGATYGEGVTQTEHALQTAALAERAGAVPALVAAALLHDIGHLLHDAPEDSAERGIDTGHESIASAWLSQFFPPEVSEPVRLHVAAKRYLCRVEPGYFDRLTDASRLSLQLQGGPLSADAVATFAAGPYANAAIELRRWDDGGKVVGRTTPALAHFRPCLAAALTS